MSIEIILYAIIFGIIGSISGAILAYKDRN
jgi:hypothetical protein